MNDEDGSVKQSPDEETRITPIRGEIVPEKPGDAWPLAVVEAMYGCYKLTRNVARARRWYLRQAREEHTPAYTTVYDWSRFYDWDARMEAEYRLEHGMLVYLTERQSLVNYAVALEVEADVLTGAFDDQPMVGAVRLKASELAQRRHERQTRTQAPTPPEEITTDTGEMTRDELEARARRALKPGKATA